jgi:uncharacterized protein YaeQ
VALTATVYSFDIELADADRDVYESLALRVARHPSESAEYLITRVLAYALEYTEGIAFSRGLSEPDEPAITVRDLTGAIRVWIEIGFPDAARLHKAAKSAARVVVYTHRDPSQLLKRLEGQRIFRSHEIELYALDRALVDALAGRLERRVAFTLAVAERELFISIGAESEALQSLSGAIMRHSLA